MDLRKRFEKYNLRVLKTVGKGTYGNVFLCEKRDSNLLTIVKDIELCIKIQNHKSDIANEVKILSKVKHPNVIRFYDCYYTENHVMISMEYAISGNLAEYMYQRCPKLIQQQLQNINVVTAGSSKRQSDSESSHPKKKIGLHEGFDVQQNFIQKGDDVIPVKFHSAHDEETVKNIDATGGSNSSTPRKKKLKGQLRFCKDKISKQGLKIKRLQSKNQRLKKKLNSIDEVLLRLEEKFAMAKENLDCLKNTNLEEILFFFSQVLLGVSYIHSLDIIHRDLKAENILLTGKFGAIVKIGDFGVSKMLQSAKQTSTVIGTPYYLAPELCHGKPYDTKSDVWALGCLLYEMCTHKRAFEAETLVGLVKAITSGSVHPIDLKTYSRGMQDLIDSMLSILPDKRPTIKNLMGRNILLETIYTVFLDAGNDELLHLKLNNDLND